MTATQGAAEAAAPRIGRRSLLGIANVAVGAVLGLIALKVSALYFGKQFLGEAAGALALFGILWVLSDLSMGEAHVKRVSEGQPVGDCFVTFVVFRIFSTAAFLLASVALVIVYVVVLGKPLQDTTLPAITFAIVYYVLKSAQQIPQSTFEARLEAARSQLASLVETIVRVGATLAFALVFAALVHKGGPLYGRVNPDAPLWQWVASNPGGALVATSAIGSLVAAVVAYAYMTRVMEPGRFRWDLLRSYLSFALPLFSISAMAVVAFFVDRLVLLFFGVAADTGDFEGPRRLVSVLEGIGGAVGFLLFPRISSMLAMGDRVAAYEVATKSVRYLSMLTVPIVAFLIAFSGPVIRLALDDDWLGNSSVLGMLAFWVLVVNVTRPLVTLLVGANQPGVVARLAVSISILHILLNLILVPDDIRSIGLDLPGLKADGAALATVITGVIYLALIAIAARRALGYRAPWPALARHAAAAAVMAFALLALDAATPFHLGRWYTFLVYVPIGAIAYALALVGLRELTRDDWAYVQETLHPGEMWRYLRGELGRKQA